MGRKSGKYEFLGNLEFFIPDSLPPREPSFRMDQEMIALYGEAMHELGRVNELTNRVPDISRFVRAYVYKEAMLSSSIEGVHTTLLDVFTQPVVDAKINKNTQLVINYTEALYSALSMLRDENLPLIIRVILRAHKELMSGGDGDKSNPGNYRKQTVRVGNLVPPPAPKIAELMSQLEKYINVEDDIPPLIRAGLVHVQFETIHPFLDGNGRIGRLLIVLMLINSGVLLEPIIYPSYFFKKRHFDYYKMLDEVRVSGGFEAWIKYYLTIIRDSSIDACKRAEKIEDLEKNIQEIIKSTKKTDKSIKSMLDALQVFFRFPVVKIKTLSEELDVSYNTAKRVIEEFVNLGFLEQEEERKRSRLFKFKLYIEILEKEIE